MVLKRITRKNLLDEQHPLFQTALPLLLKRIYANRHVQSPDEVSYDLNNLLPTTGLLNIEQAATALGEAIRSQKRILIIGDFDTDGATSTAVAVSALRQMGASQVAFLVPNRFDYGYGLTPEIVEVAKKWKPDWIVTVDNGIASIEGVLAAKAANIQVLITDHHLPGKQLPEADVIVNPNQVGCPFESKVLPGVGVIFYVMLALRQYLRENGWFEEKNIAIPNMSTLLDYVALGIVADVVPLDRNNRILVYHGVQRIRKKQCAPGILAILHIAQRDPRQITATDLSYTIAPRLNAAGRLDDMSLGISCLLEPDFNRASIMAQQLNELNQERKAIESSMQAEALEKLSHLTLQPEAQLPLGLCLYQSDWHQGVVGILASRLKDRFHRPVIALANASEAELKGSARSISEIHIRDLLDKIATENPGLITKFGGHAMAAGLSLSVDKVETFKKIFDDAVRQSTGNQIIEPYWITDGALLASDLTLETAQQMIAAGPWGQNFPEPLFDGRFRVIDQRLVGNQHLKLWLSFPGNKKILEAIAFNVDKKNWPNHRCRTVEAVYRLQINHFRGVQQLQLLIEQLTICSPG